MESVARYFSGGLQTRIAEADIDRWTWPSRRWRVRQLQPLLPRATISYEQKELEAARHGIDMRHPFADRELIEFLISLPSTVKSDPTRPKAVLADMVASGGSPAEIAKAKGFEAMGADATAAALDEVIAAHPDEWGRYREGDDKARGKLTGFFVGQVMKATKGQADGKEVTALLRQRASS